MRTTRSQARSVLVLASLALSIASMPITVRAQNPGNNAAGNNAVWSSSTSVVGSAAFVDASAWCGSGGTRNCGGVNSDFCATLSAALGQVRTTGGVVDARGVVNSSHGGAQACGSDPFAAAGIAQTNQVPITVLLPASTINLQCTWTLPSNVRLVGEGGESVLAAQQTKFCTSSSSCSASCSSPTIAMLQMGSTGCSSTICSGISIERLKLQNASTLVVDGIINDYATQSSYVREVEMSGLTGTGLYVGPQAPGSGPYTNLNFTTVAGSACTGTLLPVCADIEAPTQGLHGVTCLGDSSTSAKNGNVGYPGIKINASNNSIEDVHIESFWDGIVIGDTSSPVNNVFVSNVTGAATAQLVACMVTNTVHICGSNPGAYGSCLAEATVTNTHLSEVANSSMNANVGGLIKANTVVDDATGIVMGGCAATSGCSGSPLTTAMYLLGDSAGSVGSSSSLYSLFTTTPSSFLYADGSGPGYPTALPTWGVGRINPVTSNAVCYTPGALYSNVATTSGSSVYVCTGSPLTWQSIP